MRVKTYINKSTHELLVPNALYTLRPVQLITGLANTTLHNRFGYAESFGDHEIRSPDRAFVWPLMETKGDKLSASWLNRSLV